MYFNQPIDVSPCSKLTHLIFGYKFNQPVHHLPNSLTHLHFSYMFAQSISDIFPPNLVYLSLRRKYTFPIPSLPPSLLYFHLETITANIPPPPQVTELVWTFSDEVFNFSLYPNLTYLSISTPVSLVKCPPNITHLSVGSSVPRITTAIPSTVTHLSCPSIETPLPPNLLFLRAQEVSSPLPPSLQYLRLTENPKHKIDHLVNLTHFSCRTLSVTAQVSLPPNITHLQLVGCFNGTIEKLPSSVTHICFGDLFNQPIEFLSSSNLKFARFGRQFRQPISPLPDSLLKLDVYRCPSECIRASNTFPKSLKYLVFRDRNIEVPSHVRTVSQRILLSTWMPSMENFAKWKAPAYWTFFGCESGICSQNSMATSSNVSYVLFTGCF